MAITANKGGDHHFVGLSTDIKPTTDIDADSTFVESDTGDRFVFSGSIWKPLPGVTGGASHSTLAVTGVVTELGVFTTEATGTAVTPTCQTMTFQADSDASHTGITRIQIDGRLGSGLWNWLGELVVSGTSDSSQISFTTKNTEVRARCSVHGDDTNDVTVQMGE